MRRHRAPVVNLIIFYCPIKKCVKLLRDSKLLLPRLLGPMGQPRPPWTCPTRHASISSNLCRSCRWHWSWDPLWIWKSEKTHFIIQRMLILLPFTLVQLLQLQYTEQLIERPQDSHERNDPNDEQARYCCHLASHPFSSPKNDRTSEHAKRLPLPHAIPGWSTVSNLSLMT